jgi:hypothetical protein
LSTRREAAATLASFDRLPDLLKVESEMQIKPIVLRGENGPAQVRRNRGAGNDGPPRIRGLPVAGEPLRGAPEHHGGRWRLNEVQRKRQHDRSNGQHGHRDEQNATHTTPGYAHGNKMWVGG